MSRLEGMRAELRRMEDDLSGANLAGEGRAALENSRALFRTMRDDAYRAEILLSKATEKKWETHTAGKVPVNPGA